MSIVTKKYVWKTLSTDDTLSEPQPGGMFSEIQLNRFPHEPYSKKYGYHTKGEAEAALEGFLKDEPWFVQQLVLIPIYSRNL